MGVNNNSKAGLVYDIEEAHRRICELEVLVEERARDGKILENYKRLFTDIDDLAYICDDKGNILFVNSAFEKYTGHRPTEFIGKPFAPLFDEESLKKAVGCNARTLQGEELKFELVFKDTGVVCEYKNIPFRNERGDITGVLGMARDIIVRKRAEEAVMVERDKAQRYLDVAGVMLIVLGTDQKVSLINKKGCEILGYSEDEIVGKDWLSLFVPERVRENGRNCLTEVLAGGRRPSECTKECSEGLILAKDGSERVILWRNAVLKDDEGRITGILGSGDDITELKKAEEELKRYKDSLEELVGTRSHELKKLTAAIEQSANLICITDVNGAIEYVNPTFEEITGWSRDDAIGQNPRIIASGYTPREVYEDLWATILRGETWKGEFRNKKKNGECFWVSAVISPIKNEKGEITHFLAVHDDITEKKTSKEQLQFLAHYDGLTALLNRSRFIELLNGWIEVEGPSGSTGALFLLDIDQFKFISDTYGHGMGDEFLRRVARLLQITLRYMNSRFFNAPDRESFLCRLSGDEFALFLPKIGRVEGVVVAEQLRKSLESFYQADVPCHLTVSVGVSLYPEHGGTTTELLTKADAAMYRAKDLGRNRFHFYTPEERDIEEMHLRLRWKENILSALKEDRFETWFQPILLLEDDSVRHYEVLARMREKDGEIVLPGPIIDIAERFGLMGAISRAIIGKAMLLQARLKTRGKPLAFCLNLSGKELGDKELLYFIQSKIYETGADPNNLVFEITETSSINDLDRAIHFIKALKSMGCHISLDDFGIGYTSFLYLKELHVDYIKIAGSFVKGLDRNLNDQLFVRAIIDVARGMGIKTVAEFVEKETIKGLLKSYGVDYAQGYLIGTPGPVFDYEGFAE